MATFTSKASGNWSATGQTTWNEVGVPGDGDTVTIGAGHTITVDVNTTIGDSPSTPTDVITANTTGAITVAAGVTFTIKGCVQMEDGNFTMNAGSTVEFQVPSTKRYWFRTAKAHSDTCKIIINGTSGSRCAFRSSSGAGIAYIDSNGLIGSSLIQAEYCDFTLIGDATEDFAEPYPSGSGLDFYMRNCTLTSCGILDNQSSINTNASFELTNCRWATTVAAKCIEMQSTTAPAGGKTRSIVGCYFDKTIDLFEVIGWTITNTYFGDGFSGTSTAGGTSWALFKDNFIQKASAQNQTVFGDTADCYVYKTSVANPHGLQTGIARGLTISGCVFEHGGTQTDGDCIIIGSSAASPYSYTITNNVMLPNSAGDNSGTLFSALGNANVTLTVNHNTYFNNAADSGAAIAETYTGHSGLLASFRSNLAWSDTANESQFMQDSGTNDAVAGYVTNCGYNGIWNPRATRYDVPVGTITNDYTANDVSGDPDFVDETRDLASWDASLGGAGTASAALARLAADPYLIDDLVTWVKDGFKVQSLSFKDAGHDGVTIGAMGYQAPATGGSNYTTPAQGPLFSPAFSPANPPIIGIR